MACTTVGILIQQIRREKKITGSKLAYGICSKQVLKDIEADQNEADILMLDILMQRMGQSPDKFEMILRRDAYHMIRLRDLIEETIYRGKRTLAEKLLHSYPARTSVDQMYHYRMKASLIYHTGGDCNEVEKNLQKAIAVTLPKFSYDQIEAYMISTVEMENILALERMCLEEKYKAASVAGMDMTEERRHLELCMDYIERHFEDQEEHAKIYSKCAWLLAGIHYLSKNYMETIRYCERGIEVLWRSTILYFILPLLKLGTKAQKAVGIPPERSKWVQYYENLMWIWERYAKEWYPTDAIFHNCYQREYHLDYEFIRAERKAQEMTQAKLADGVYRNTECLSRVETGKVSPNKKTFEKLMKKLGVEKSRYNAYVVTDSFEAMEIKRKIDGCLMRRNYQEAGEVTRELKSRLDIDIEENKRVIRMYEVIVSKCLEETTALEALEGLKELCKPFYNVEKKEFSHIPMRNEVLLINNICIALKEIGQEQEAVELYINTIDKIKSSKVKVKYRYRSYALILNNAMISRRDCKNVYEGIRNELFCGKAMGIPLGLNNIVHALEKTGILKEEDELWAKAIYYMSDLYGFKEEKELYKDYIEKEYGIMLLE